MCERAVRLEEKREYIHGATLRFGGWLCCFLPLEERSTAPLLQTVTDTDSVGVSSTEKKATKTPRC